MPDSRDDRQDERERLDAELSALVDGELDDLRAQTLRARIARDEELARRLARFEAVDGALRELPAPERPLSQQGIVDRGGARCYLDRRP